MSSPLPWHTPTPFPDYYDLSNFTFNPDTDAVGHHRIPWSHRVALALYAAIFLLGIPGNAAVVWLSSPAQRRAVPAVWFLHLAVADLLCCAALPFLAIPVAGDHRWPLGDFGCKLFPALAVLNMYASVLLLGAISADRCLMVTRPAWCHNHRTPRAAHRVCFAVWLAAAILTVPTFLFRTARRDAFADAELCVVDYSIAGRHRSFAEGFTVALRFAAGFLLPFSAIAACHALLLARLHSRGFTRMRRAAGTVLAVVVTFFVCWLPYHVVGLILAATSPSAALYRGAAAADPVLTGLAYANSCANPLIYAAAAGRRGGWGGGGERGRGSWCAALRRVLSEEPNSSANHGSRSNTNAATVDTEV
uniref:C5a anaphylatoxin chemotactic receptor 1 n=1 Tax=Pavo cristatus TaxID=9049 RepID=A0A8C9G3T6_PAVCR